MGTLTLLTVPPQGVIGWDGKVALDGGALFADNKSSGFVERRYLEKIGTSLKSDGTVRDPSERLVFNVTNPRSALLAPGALTLRRGTTGSKIWVTTVGTKWDSRDGPNGHQATASTCDLPL